MTNKQQEDKKITTNGGEILVGSSSEADEKEVAELYKHSQILSQATSQDASKV